MNWLDRYVAAVTRNLPGAVREDIGEEIRSLLEDKIDSTRELKSEPARESDVLFILKEFGHPMEVAARYMDRRVLISEPLFPVYRLVVKYVLIFALTLYAVSAIIGASGLLPWWKAATVNTMVSIALWYLLIVTVAFHLLDRHLRRIDFFKKWDPRRLPANEEGARNVPIASSVFSVFVSVVVFGILTSINNEYSWDVLMGRSENEWHGIVLLAKVYATLNVVLYLSLVYHPYWTRARLLCRAGIALFMSLIAVRVMVIVLAALPWGQDMEWGAMWLVVSSYVTIAAFIIAGLVEMFYCLYRYVHIWRV